MQRSCQCCEGLSRPAGFLWLTRRAKVKEILPKFTFLCHMDILTISSLLTRSASRLAFAWESSGTCCAPQTAPVSSPVPGYGHKAWAQLVSTAVSKTPLSNVLFCMMCFWSIKDLSPQIGKRIS